VVVVVSACDVEGVADEWALDSDARRLAPPMKPVSFSVVLPSVSETAESCLERRFSLLRIDLKPFDELGDVGEVGSAEDGAVAVEPRVGAVVVESLATAVVSVVIPVGAVGSSYKSALPSVAVAAVGAAGVATTAVPNAGPVPGAARSASFDFRCSSFARRCSSVFLVFSASLACFAATLSSAIRAFAALFPSSV
jgi:hypothetical protein